MDSTKVTTENAVTEEDVILGAVDIFITEFSGSIPDDETFENASNQFAQTKGGTSIAYTGETYTTTSDNGVVSKTVVTEEKVVAKSGIMTVNGTTLSKLCQTARVVYDPVKKERVTKIGGIKNANGKSYALRFRTFDKKKRVTIVGQNQAGFTLPFAKGKETIIDAEFIAKSMDDEGTLVEYREKLADDVDNTYIASISGLTLSPVFMTGIKEYTAETANTSDIITVVPQDTTNASVKLYVGGSEYDSGDEITWAEGQNILTIIVSAGTSKSTTTILVTKS